MAARFDGITDYYKSGLRRLRDAEELMEPPSRTPETSDAKTRHLRGAMYLAGYAVECLVKVYIIEQEGCQYLSDAVKRINERREKAGQEKIKPIDTSASGHEISYLISITNIATLHRYDVQLWGRVASWRSAWRYNPAPATRAEAESFLDDVKAVCDWLTPKIAFR